MDPNRVIKVIWPMVLNHAMEKLYKIYVCHHWSLLPVSATKCINQHMLLHFGSPLSEVAAGCFHCGCTAKVAT